MHAFTLIAFIGSVFSPYYAWSGRADPLNHCAVNLALYSPGASRWCMTERGRRRLTRTPTRLQIGPSALERTADGGLRVSIAEHAAPLPSPVRGTITLTPRSAPLSPILLDSAGRHVWQPLAPRARVSLDFAQPGLSWQGEAYLDHNRGSEPLEAAFRFWDWARFPHPEGGSVILYNTCETSGAIRQLALYARADGTSERLDPPPVARLPASPVFRMTRTTRSETGQARVLRTLEDAPFYSRSLVETQLVGERLTGVHESFSGPRFAAPLTRLMLPFRMPRIA